MTLDEAIYLLGDIVVDQPHGFSDKPYEAIKLGIEGLKFVAHWNQNQLPQHQILLPGETEKKVNNAR